MGLGTFPSRNLLAGRTHLADLARYLIAEYFIFDDFAFRAPGAPQRIRGLRTALGIHCAHRAYCAYRLTDHAGVGWHSPAAAEATLVHATYCRFARLYSFCGSMVHSQL